MADQSNVSQTNCCKFLDTSFNLESDFHVSYVTKLLVTLNYLTFSEILATPGILATIFFLQNNYWEILAACDLHLVAILPNMGRAVNLADTTKP